MTTKVSLIGDSSVTGAAINNLTITTDDIANNAVTTDKIAPNAVTTAKIDFQNALVPIGGIIMWSGITVPTGWALCDGAPGSGTPDLRNKFIVAADSLTKTGTTSQSGTSPYDPGDVGGDADSIVVSHSHTATSTATDSGHTHNWGYEDGLLGQGLRAGASSTYFSRSRNVNTGYANVTVATSITPAGSPASNANLPPYYALAFIMRTS